METKQIVEIFLNENNRNSWNFLFKDELYKCEQEFNKQFFDFNEKELMKYFSMLKISDKKIKSMSQIATVKSKYKNFFNWCIENGYANNNPIAENKKLLSDKAILKYIKPNSKILYTPDEINAIFLKLRGTVDGFYLEGIVRALYEGVPNILKFVELKYLDLNTNNNILDLGDYKLPITNELKDIFLMVHEMEKITITSETRNINYNLKDLFGSLYKFPVKTEKNIWENDKKTYYDIAKGIHLSRFSTIEWIIGSEMDENILKNSYLFKHLLQYMDGDVDKVKKLINTEDAQLANVTIDKIMAKTNYLGSVNEIRRRLIPYFIKK